MPAKRSLVAINISGREIWTENYQESLHFFTNSVTHYSLKIKQAGGDLYKWRARVYLWVIMDWGGESGCYFASSFELLLGFRVM
jgi:hypothetical protein